MTISKQLRLLDQSANTSFKKQTPPEAQSQTTATQRASTKRSYGAKSDIDTQPTATKAPHRSGASAKPFAPQAQTFRRTQGEQMQRFTSIGAELAGIRTGLSARGGTNKEFGRGSVSALDAFIRPSSKYAEADEPYAEHHALSKAGRQERLKTNRKKSQERLSKADRRMLEEDGFDSDI